ncbi:MAG TPA: cell division protein ZapA [Limnochordia bacterium]|nr:cell division protein ZapA [Limnochordia bacterium]
MSNELANAQTGGPARPESPTARVEVEILDERCTLRADRPEAYIKRMAALVDEKLRQVRAQDPNLVLHRAAILVALNLADELEHERQKVAEIRRRLAERA